MCCGRSKARRTRRPKSGLKKKVIIKGDKVEEKKVDPENPSQPSQ